MYDKYTARPAVFLSCNFIERVPAGYCVPVGLMVAFLQCDKRNNRGFQKIFVVRDVNPCVFLNFVI